MLAINKKLSLFKSFAISIAGMIAPSMFPKCGVPVLCIPVSILAILMRLRKVISLILHKVNPFRVIR